MFSKKSIKNIKPYKLSSHKAWQVENANNILKLDWNEATIPPSPAVFHSINLALKTKKINWYPNIDNKKLKESISIYTGNNIEEIQYFASSDCLHEYIVRAFIDEKDKVLSLTPTYDNFRAVAEANGAKMTYFDLDEKFNLNYDLLELEINKLKPKVVYIVNPNNPTGTLHSKNNLIRLINKFQNVLFVIDEAYYEFSSISLSQYVSKCNNLIISRTFSKAFALASFRIGYAISSKKIINELNKIRNPKNISLFAQEAAIAALNDFSYTKNYVKNINDSKILFIKSILNYNWIKVFKGHGNFIFLKILNSEIKSKLLIFFENKNIFIRDYGHIEKTKNFVRITIGLKEQMKTVISELEKFDKSIL